jgi:2-keto-4-pentenoate hydratase/2-oxohepta-3-ene-1,7-dioic acid hydratase in catechol pathway
MRIVRFTPKVKTSLGSDPQFGILGGENQIRLIAGDPLYSGVLKLDETVSLTDVKLLAPVIPRSKVVCVGKNYADHAAEMGGEVPKEPIIFLKPNTSVIGPNDLIRWPIQSNRVDYEAELAIVISRICKDVPKEKAADVIFGYTIANDVTARDIQKTDGQWTRAKSFDTFCPVGPWIDTEFKPASQRITTVIKGETHQNATLNQMVFDIPTIISFITSVMTLLPGDLILTGTPSGIGPLTPGEDVVVSIQDLGELRNEVIRSE